MENKNQFWEDAYSKGSMLNKYPFNYLVQIVLKYFGSIQERSDISVLEIGCGSGNNLHFLASEGFRVEGFDLSESAIKFANKRFKKDSLDGILKVSGFDYLNNQINKYDMVLERAVFYTQSLDYLKNKVFPNIKRSLKKGGLFISYFYNNNHPDKTFLKSMDVLSTPTKEEILELFSDFTIESITENSTKDIFGKSILGEKSEYIIIVRKGDE